MHFTHTLLLPPSPSLPLSLSRSLTYTHTHIHTHTHTHTHTLKIDITDGVLVCYDYISATQVDYVGIVVPPANA